MTKYIKKFFRGIWYSIKCLFTIIGLILYHFFYTFIIGIFVGIFFGGIIKK